MYTQVPATTNSIEENPNCPWRWARASQTFNSETDAKTWINDNREMLISELYFAEDK